jgi:hypothetical protein
MEAAGSSETCVTIYQTTLRHIQEESNLYSHSRENPKARKLNLSVSFIVKDLVSHPYETAGNIVRFLVLTKVNIKITSFWDVTPCTTL